MFGLFLVPFAITKAISSDFLGMVMSMMQKNFGGEITKMKARDVETLEEAGYECVVAGDTIEINPQKKTFPSSYFISYSAQQKKTNKLQTGQKIIGKYYGKTTITCTKECPPAICIETVLLDTVKVYGNSKK